MRSFGLISSVICWSLIILCFHSPDIFVTAADRYWYEGRAQATLRETLSRKDSWKVAKNVVLVIGDGMSLATVAAARILKGQKAGRSGIGEEMVYETFPHVGLARTYAVDKYVPDSASTATAFLCGIKTKYETVGVDEDVVHGDCQSVTGKKVRCIGEWAMAEDKVVGLVTNMRVTHATPSALYAHSADRWWEGDTNMKSEKDRTLCKDIARQLVEEYPGKNLQVILGGGREHLMPNTTFDPEYPEVRGKRADGRALLDAWRRQKKDAGRSHRFVWNKKDFDAVDPSHTDFLLGLFEPAHMHDITDKDDQKSDFDEPTLSEMTEKAILLLRRNPRGYFLMVEGGLIDKRHHMGKAVRAVNEALELERAVQTILRLVSLEDTLVVVTSDHSHGLQLVGYADVGTDIFGIADVSTVDGMPYTSLLYSSGVGYRISSTGRQNITGIDTANKDYLQQATIPRSSTTHGGEDVGVYAAGPMAHLFSGVYDQHYLAHAMAYAACIGRNKEHCQGAKASAVVTSSTNVLPWISLALVLMRPRGSRF